MLLRVRAGAHSCHRAAGLARWLSCQLRTWSSAAEQPCFAGGFGAVMGQTGLYLPEHMGGQTPCLRCVLLPLLHPASSAECCVWRDRAETCFPSVFPSSQQGWRASLPLKAEPVTLFPSMQQGDENNKRFSSCYSINTLTFPPVGADKVTQLIGLKSGELQNITRVKAGISWSRNALLAL